MPWPPPFPPSRSSDDVLIKTLTYSDKFSYPLTLDEIRFWQIGFSFPKKVFSGWPYSKKGFYFLEGRDNIVNIREKRSEYSRDKLIIAGKSIRLLSYIPTIDAIFLTGSLAMNNSPRFDDIDILIISKANTLWVTRLLVIMILVLFRTRRPPRLSLHSSVRVSDKICDNMYLDSEHLTIIHNPNVPEADLYLAHEILQAKCIFDRGGVNRRFLTQNVWAKQFLPVAYRGTLKNCNSQATKSGKTPRILSGLLFAINYLSFALQYLYMRPGLTYEKVGLGFAYFHPDSSSRQISPERS